MATAITETRRSSHHLSSFNRNREGAIIMTSAAAAPQEVQTVSFPVPADDVGRLIGKQGLQIKSIREQSQCHITVDSSSKEKQPNVTLKGSPDSIAEARRLIAGIIGGQGVAFVRDMDESAVAALTRDRWLHEKSTELGVTTQVKGRFIKIVVDNNNKDPNAAERFKDLLEQRISGQSETVEQSVAVDLESLRRIKEDPGIKQLESIHHLKLEVAKTDAATLLVFRGQKGVVNEALKSVAGILEPSPSGGNRRNFIPLTAELFEGCSQKKLNDLRSDVADAVEQRFKVRVDVTPGSTQAVIEGSEIDNVHQAKEELELILQYYFNENCAVLPIPVAAIPDICGNKDEKLLRFQNLQLHVMVDRSAGRLWICGLARAAENAYQKFKSEIEDWVSRNVLICLDNRQIGLLVGARGENIRRLQDETGATIAVVNSEGSQAVHIKADSAEITTRAKQAVERHIRNIEHRPQQQQQQQQQQNRPSAQVSSSFNGRQQQQQQKQQQQRYNNYPRN